MVIICQLEEMEYKEQEAKAGAWSTWLGLRAWLGMEVGKWLRNVASRHIRNWVGEVAEEAAR